MNRKKMYCFEMFPHRFFEGLNMDYKLTQRNKDVKEKLFSKINLTRNPK